MPQDKATMELIMKDGTVESYPLTAADDDWIRAGRLAEAAEQGDKEAQKQLDIMNSSEFIVK